MISLALALVAQAVAAQSDGSSDSLLNLLTIHTKRTAQACHDRAVCIIGTSRISVPDRPYRQVTIMVTFNGVDRDGTGHADIQPVEFADMDSCREIAARLKAASVSAACFNVRAAVK